MNDYLKIAFRNIKKRKLRAFLTLIGIIIAITTIFVLLSVSIGLQDAVKEQFRELGTDKIFIQPRGQIAGPGSGGAVSLTQKDVDAIKKIPGVKQVSSFVVANAKIEFKDEIRFVPIAGMDIETIELFIESGSYELESGRLLKKGDTISIIVGSQYKHNAFFSKPADINDKILINDKLFTIKGNFKSVGNPSDDRLIYMPIENLRELFNIPDRIDTIIVQIEENGDIYQIADRINRRLINLRDTDKDNPDFSILTPEELLESFGSVLNIITAFLFGVAGISLLVGGIGIANTMFTSVLERTKEIGIMKAIGAQNKHIFLIFVIEAILLGTFGGFLGVVFGILIAKTIEYIAVVYLATTLLKSAIPLYLIAGCIAFSSVVGAVSGFWPAYRAVKTIPVQALRYE